MSTQKQTWTFICPELNKDNDIIFLSPDEHHYAYHVLRVQIGQEVELTNCNGLKATGLIQTVNKKEISIIVKEIILTNKPNLHINLILASPKPTTLEEVIASASEIGATEVHIFKPDRSASKAPFKLEKLKLISDEAVRISKSPYSAEIYIYDNIAKVFSALNSNANKNYLLLFCDESHIYEGKITNSIYTKIKEYYRKEIQKIYLLVGPEASFSEQERELISKQSNAVSVSLGGNILRVPNAAISALGVALNFRNDLSLPIQG